MSETKKFINIRQVIADKNPKLLKWLPRFVLRYIEKTIHQDDINEFMVEQKGASGIEFCQAVIDKFNIKMTAVDLNHVPATGGCVLAINHPLGGMDAMALVTLLKTRRTDIKFIVNDVLLNLTNLQEMFVGVNVLGKNAKASLQKVDALFQTDQLICIFPAGLVSRRHNGVVKDLVWKKTFVARAKKYNRPILPVHINGELSNFFYRLASFRTAIGLKANLEMFYLVDEMFQQHDKEMNVVFGKPIDPSTLDKSKSDYDWAQHIKDLAYSLEQ